MNALRRKLPQRYRLRLWLAWNYLRPSSFRLRRAQPSRLEQRRASRAASRWRSAGGVTRVSHAFVVNLETRPDRLEGFKREMQRLGVAGVERLDAVPHEQGAIGCALSHVEALERMRSNGWTSLLVCEDDARFRVDRRTLDALVDAFLDDDAAEVACLAYHVTRSERYNALFRRGFRIQTTACYLVKHTIAADLVSLWRDGIAQLEAGGDPHVYSCDRTWMKLQAERVFLIPVLRAATQESGYSDVMGRVVTYTH